MSPGLNLLAIAAGVVVYLELIRDLRRGAARRRRLVRWILSELPADPGEIPDRVAWAHTCGPLYAGLRPGARSTVHEYLRGRIDSEDLERQLDWRFGFGPRP